jgi:hypothetical protein
MSSTSIGHKDETRASPAPKTGEKFRRVPSDILHEMQRLLEDNIRLKVIIADLSRRYKSDSGSSVGSD